MESWMTEWSKLVAGEINKWPSVIRTWWKSKCQIADCIRFGLNSGL